MHGRHGTGRWNNSRGKLGRYAGMQEHAFASWVIARRIRLSAALNTVLEPQLFSIPLGF